MSISPNGVLYIMAGVPLEKNYENTLFFATRPFQTEYFTNKGFIRYQCNDDERHESGSIYSYTSYIRTNKGTIKVPILCDNLYGCNYMMFRNTKISDDKWFYAFIDDVTYINDGTSEISYTIDVIQTFMFDYELGECFVEREHSETDEIGDNLEQENLETGDTITHPNSQQIIDDFNDISMVAVCNRWGDVDFTEEQPQYVEYAVNGAVYGGTQGAVGDFGYASVKVSDRLTPTDSLKRFLNNLSHLPENAVLSVFMMPTELIPTYNGTKSYIKKKRSEDAAAYNLLEPEYIPKAIKLYNYNVSNSELKKFKYNQKLGNPSIRKEYTPKNNKLYTFPYYYINVSNEQGESKIFRYEYFPWRPFLDFAIYCNMSTRPCAYLQAESYANTPALEPQSRYGLKMGEFPLVPIKFDGWSQWKYSGGIASALINMAGTALVGGITGGAGAAVGGANGLLSLASNSYYSRYRSNETPSTGDTTPISMQRMNFLFTIETILPEYAERIDKYFSLYGYATNKIKKPNIRARVNWTYTKTNGCILLDANNLGIPAKYEQQICSIFDRGVRFWRVRKENNVYVGDNVGDYGDFTNDPYSQNTEERGEIIEE